MNVGEAVVLVGVNGEKQVAVVTGFNEDDGTVAVSVLKPTHWRVKVSSGMEPGTVYHPNAATLAGELPEDVVAPPPPPPSADNAPVAQGASLFPEAPTAPVPLSSVSTTEAVPVPVDEPKAP